MKCTLAVVLFSTVLVVAGLSACSNSSSVTSLAPVAPSVLAGRSTDHLESTNSYRVLHRFGGDPDGVTPYSGLLDVNGTLYGTTLAGGKSFPGGTVYRTSTTRRGRILHRFKGDPDGEVPYSTLIDVDGTLYGTTAGGVNVRRRYRFSA